MHSKEASSSATGAKTRKPNNTETAREAPIPEDASAPLIVKGSMHELFVQMKQEVDGITPFPTRFTRTDYLLSTCYETGVQSGKNILHNLAARRWSECPWFMIPIEHMREIDYAHFLYLFVNLIYNPEKKFMARIDGEDDDTSQGTPVPSSTAYMTKCFSWLHAHSIKLSQFVKKIAPDWDMNADSALLSVARVCKNERAKYDAYLRHNVAEYIRTNLPKGATPDEEIAAEQITRRAFITNLHALIKASPKKLRIEARKAKISTFGMLMVSLEFDDLYMQTRAARAKEEADKKKETDSKATPAAVATASTSVPSDAKGAEEKSPL